jgi:GR25 family glycosyltransferase involved in LPS biosynthesis
MDMFVINLDRNPERMREFQRINAHVPQVKRLAAIDGKAMDRADLIAQRIFEEPIAYTDGAIGNALSHLRAWEMAAKKTAPTTIFEDDAIIHNDFEMLTLKVISELPTVWDLILWGWNFDTVMGFDLFADTPCLARFSQVALRQHWQDIQKFKIQPSAHRLHYAFGSVGYTVSPSGAKKLLALATPIKPFLYKIPAFDLDIPNEAMDCVMASLYDRLDAFACFPPLVVTKNERAGSTVQTVSEEKKEQSLLMTPTDYTNSRKFKKKQARYLFKQGDVLGGAGAYLKYLFTGRQKPMN